MNKNSIIFIVVGLAILIGLVIFFKRPQTPTETKLDETEDTGGLTPIDPGPPIY